MALPKNAGEVDEMLRAQAHIMRHVAGHVCSKSLKCAINLGIPDAVEAHGKPITLPELVSALGLESNKAHYVARLMRLLAHTGFFTTHEDGTYSLAPPSKLLLKSNPLNLRQWANRYLDPYVVPPMDMMDSWFRQNEHGCVFQLANGGKSMWEVAADDPEFNRLFNMTMANDSQLVSAAVVIKCRDAFDGVTTLVDVGGGNGTFVRTIAEAFPHITCIVYDLPHVIDTVPKSPIVRAIGGNMFEHIPSADAILLKKILHTWSDEDCVKILKRCKEAIPKNGKVMIVDIVKEANKADGEFTEMQFIADVILFTSSLGFERDEQEWKKIFADAGFIDYKITPLGLRSLIELYP